MLDGIHGYYGTLRGEDEMLRPLLKVCWLMLPEEPLSGESPRGDWRRVETLDVLNKREPLILVTSIT